MATFRKVAIAALALEFSWPQLSYAASNAATFLARQQVSIGCHEGSGAFSQIWETDINADGKPDLILNHANIQCDNGDQSANCGARGACEILIYIRKGNLLKSANELAPILDSAYSVDKLPGGRLKFVIGPAASQTKIVRWNGKKFE